MNDDTQATGNAAPAQDTAATQPSEADVQQVNEAPEVTQGTEAAEGTATAEVSTEDTAEDKLYAGKYKSVDDLEKSYKELESKYGKEAAEKAELTRVLNEAFSEVETETTDEGYQEDSGDPRIEALERKTAVQDFILTHQDVDLGAMQEILANDPLISQLPGYEARLEVAYLKSKNMTTKQAIEEANKTAQKTAQENVLKREAAQVESATKAEPVEEEQLMGKVTGNYSAEERDAARKALIRKHLINL